MIGSLIFLAVVAFFVFKTVRIVPQQSAYVSKDLVNITELLMLVCTS